MYEDFLFMVCFFEFGLFGCEITLTLGWFGFVWCVNLCVISLVVCLGFCFCLSALSFWVWTLLCSVGGWSLYGVINCNSKTYICLLVMSYYCCCMLRSVLILCCVNVFGCFLVVCFI